MPHPIPTCRLPRIPHELQYGRCRAAPTCGFGGLSRTRPSWKARLTPPIMLHVPVHAMAYIARGSHWTDAIAFANGLPDFRILAVSFM
jgi:hypothetical protein